MTQAGITLLAVAAVSIFFRDYILASAAGILLLLNFFVDKSTLAAAGKPVFSVGIFFLMMFILMPVAAERIRVSDLLSQLKNPLFYFSLATAILVSHVGGRGVSFLQQPSILFAIVLGTLIGVLFFRGLPAGLIIAAGIVSLAAGATQQ